MTLSEFKAWFEGYTEGLEAAPTKAQFDRIKEKVKLIDGAPVVQTIWLDYYRRYYPTYVPYPTPVWGQPYLGGVTFGGMSYAGNATAGAQGRADAQAYSNNFNAADLKLVGQQASTFDSHSAMYALGKAEAIN